MLIWPDIFGLRPAFRQMGKRLAQSGYAVLVVNPFYRQQKAPTAPEHPDFNDPATRSALMALMGALTPETSFTDAKAFMAVLTASRPSTANASWAPPATAWVGRSRCEPPPPCPSAWARAAPFTGEAW